MSRNTDDRRALAAIESERMEDQIAYYRKPFMVLWAAVQEASSELEEDYGLSSDVSQLWVAERLRQVSDSLVDRLAEKAVQHGTSKSNVARAADSIQRMPCADFLVFDRELFAPDCLLTRCSIRWNDVFGFAIDLSRLSRQ